MTEDEFNKKNKDQDADPNDPNKDRDFGLPKVEIKPIQPAGVPAGEPKERMIPKEMSPVTRSESLKPPEREKKISGKTEPTYMQDTDKNNKSWWLMLIILVILGLGAWFVLDYMGQEEAQPVVVEEKIEEPLPARPEPEVAEEPEEPVEEITLTEISVRGDVPRYFVVVGSFVDEDLAKDYSQKLNQNGLNTFLVYPYGDIPYYRLAIGQFDRFDLAAKEINRIKAGYNENLWVLKY